LPLRGFSKLLYKKTIVKGKSRKTAGSLQLTTLLNPELTRKRKYSPLAHLLLEVIPGLPQVAKGNLNLVGLHGKSPKEFSQLSPAMKDTYKENQPGLISECFVLYKGLHTPEEENMADLYYLAKKSFTYDLKLLWRYFALIIS
jgi:lipopolysaccharide/colanic/teichoic acid biosynthesis glycosyltransferase